MKRQDRSESPVHVTVRVGSDPIPISAFDDWWNAPREGGSSVGYAFGPNPSTLIVTMPDGSTVAMPSRVFVRTEDGVELELAAAPEGRYVVVQVNMRGTVADPVTATRLKALPVQRIIEQATKAVARPVDWTEEGATVSLGGKPLSDDYSRMVARKPRAATITDEYLRDVVAPIIRAAEAKGRPYGPAVAAALHVSPETARNYRMRLRKIEGEKR